MTIKKIIRKALLVLFGIIIGLILAEAGLNAVETVYKKFLKVSNPDNFHYDSKACRIVCLGDSWTFGMGAAQKKDYPIQLENILNQSSGGNNNFKVYNLGYPNFTSSMALKKFEDVFPGLKPNIVIAMIGRSDQWVFEDLNIEKNFPEKIKQIILDTRLAKLIKISIYNLHYNIFTKKEKNLPGTGEHLEEAMALIKSGNDYRVNKRFSDAEECYNKALFLVPQLTLGYIEKARNNKLKGQYEKALTCLRKIYISNMENKEINQELDDIFIMMNVPQRKVEFYYSLFNQNPQSITLRHQLARAYIESAEALYVDKQLNKTLENYEKALQLEPENKEIYSRIIYNQALINKSVVSSIKDLPSLKNKTVFALSQKTKLENNLYKLVKICKQNNIELIFSGYPREIPGPMQQVAADCGISLIDHRKSFKSAKGDFFVSDGHCNSAGYRMVAENIAKHILSNKKNQSEW